MSASVIFSHRVKAEAAGNITGRKKCDAALGGMILFSREISPEKIVFRTENSDVRDLFVRLCEHAAGEGSVTVEKIRRESDSSLYSLSICGPQAISAISDRVSLSSLERTLRDYETIPDKLFGAFVAGIFLGCGSVADPEKGYHLEFVTPDEKICRELGAMLSERLYITGGIVKRRSSYVLYFKESEHIEDILTLIGAQRASLELMNLKIYKDLRNHANRATNCDTANVGRQNRSAVRQIEAIEVIKASGRFDKLPSELKSAAELRIENPDLSLSELTLKSGTAVSRSGMNHRLQKLIDIAGEIKNA